MESKSDGISEVLLDDQPEFDFEKAKLEALGRPEEIYRLISHQKGRLAPQRVKVVGDLVPCESPLGKTVGGTHPETHLSPIEIKTQEQHQDTMVETSPSGFDEHNVGLELNEALFYSDR
ncbi:hypothetical protein Q8A73_010577 [Channa argus]|nr:hypothetical protein Q8A73_010577 [Channa argus]